jgi:hypothetical protein
VPSPGSQRGIAERVDASVARPRLLYAGFLALTIIAGLASRRFPEWQPEFVARFAGDALWAAMVFWILGLIAPRRSTSALAAWAVGIACAVEVSQLYRAPWIDGVRSTTVGALVLGQGFLWSDLACYAVGVGLAAALEAAMRSRRCAELGVHGGKG